MARAQKINPRELLADLAREEMVSDGVAIDYEPIFERWKLDPVAFINETKILGGPCHPQQVVILNAAWQMVGERPEMNDLVICKTRQVGMSWLWMAFELWLILFWPDMRVLNSSRKEGEVDDGGAGSTVASLHGRIRQMHARLPGWLRRRCPIVMKTTMISSKNGSFIKGASATADVGRGSTYDFALLDEFAHVDWSTQVWASVSQACKKGKVGNSTPKGRGNEFAALWFGAEKRAITKVGYHWTAHPVYSIGLYTDNDGRERSPWYDHQCQVIGSVAMIAQELDMSFDQSQGARVYPEFSRKRHIADVIRNEATPLICAWDYGYSGATAMILAQLERYEGSTVLEIITVHEGKGLHIDAYVPIIGAWESMYGKARHVGDPAGVQRTVASGRGPIQALAEHGIYTAAPIWLHRDAIEGIRLTSVALAGGRVGNANLPFRIHIDPSCTRLIDSLENTHYPIDSNGNALPGKEMPADNEWTHMSDAFRYLTHWVCRTMLGVGASSDDEQQGAITQGALTRTF